MEFLSFLGDLGADVILIGLSLILAAIKFIKNVVKLVVVIALIVVVLMILKGVFDFSVINWITTLCQ